MNERVVFDCMIFLQAASRPDRTHGLFEAVSRGELSLFVSAEVLAEVNDVLSRPRLQRQFPALTPEVVKAFVADVLSRAHFISPVPHVYSFPRDPKDEKYIDLALAVEARYIVSADNDLLDLMDEATPEGKAFRQRFPALQILKPGVLLREIEMRRMG